MVATLIEKMHLSINKREAVSAQREGTSLQTYVAEMRLSTGRD